MFDERRWSSQNSFEPTKGGDACLRKTSASSDMKKNKGEGFLPAEVIWRAAQMFCQNGVEVSPIDAEPTPEEMLGLTIGILRRHKHISHEKFARSIGCSVEELLALEAGLLPKKVILKYLPAIAHATGVNLGSLQPLARRIKIA